jgi:hypothetical protein
VALDSRRQRRPAAVACGRTIKEAFSSSMASAGHGLMHAAHAEPVSRLSSAPGQRTEATHTRTTLGPCLVSLILPKFNYEKEDLLSHQNVGKCMEY